MCNINLSMTVERNITRSDRMFIALKLIHSFLCHFGNTSYKYFASISKKIFRKDNNVKLQAANDSGVSEVKSHSNGIPEIVQSMAEYAKYIIVSAKVADMIEGEIALKNYP